jgi:hypothetical protein
MDIDSSGNVGIGTSSPGKKLSVNGEADVAAGSGYFRVKSGIADSHGIQFNYNNLGTGVGHISNSFGSGGLAFGGGASAEHMRLDSSGNLLVGTTSAISGYLFRVNGQGAFAGPSSDVDGNGGVRIDYGNSSGTVLRFLALNANGSTNAAIGLNMVDSSNGSMVFSTRGSNSLGERMRIDSSGNLLVGTTSAAANEQGLVVRSPNVAGKLTGSFTCTSSATSAYGISVIYSALTPNNTSSEFFVGTDSSTNRFSVRSNGGIANYSANNVNLSDRREKKNFSPAGSYLDKICAIPVQTFNYIDQNMEEDGGLTLGVVAQDVQAVAPELVMESNWAKMDDEPKMRLSIYQTDLQYALMKCIQEQQALIQDLTTRLAALEAK